MLLPCILPDSLLLPPRRRRNSFDTVLIPTQLVVDTCYATFVNLEGKKLDEEGVKAAWGRRLAMLASNAGEEGQEEEAFLVSKYDLVPESLADMVQVSFFTLFPHRKKTVLHCEMPSSFPTTRGYSKCC